MIDQERPETPDQQPDAGGAYERLADGALVRVGGGTAMPDRIAPELGEPASAPPSRDATDTAPPRTNRPRRS